jgi:prepilin-type N-terminal cleavage/methylation domain-containing protein
VAGNQEISEESTTAWSVRGFQDAPPPPKDCHRSKTCDGLAANSGFTLIELLVVLAIALVVAAFAVPTMVTTLDAFRMRGAMGSASGISQRCRTVAIKKDLSQRLHFATVGGRVVLFVTDSADAAVAPLPADKQLSAQVWLPGQFSIPGAPAGVGAPTLLTGTIMWGTVLVPNVNVDPYFNSRGLPCLPDPITGVCNATTGFVYYFKYTGSGSSKWTATSISPAGRIESWFWNGVGWGN